MDQWLRDLSLSPASERQMLLAGAELLRSGKVRCLPQCPAELRPGTLLSQCSISVQKRQQRSLFARDAFRYTQRALLTLKVITAASKPCFDLMEIWHACRAAGS